MLITRTRLHRVFVESWADGALSCGTDICLPPAPFGAGCRVSLSARRAPSALASLTLTQLSRCLSLPSPGAPATGPGGTERGVNQRRGAHLGGRRRPSRERGPTSVQRRPQAPAEPWGPGGPARSAPRPRSGRKAQAVGAGALRDPGPPRGPAGGRRGVRSARSRPQPPAAQRLGRCPPPGARVMPLASLPAPRGPALSSTQSPGEGPTPVRRPPAAPRRGFRPARSRPPARLQSRRPAGVLGAGGGRGPSGAGGRGSGPGGGRRPGRLGGAGAGGRGRSARGQPARCALRRPRMHCERGVGSPRLLSFLSPPRRPLPAGVMSGGGVSVNPPGAAPASAALPPSGCGQRRIPAGPGVPLGPLARRCPRRLQPGGGTAPRGKARSAPWRPARGRAAPRGGVSRAVR